MRQISCKISKNTSVSFSRDGKHILSGFDDNNVLVWDVDETAEGLNGSVLSSIHYRF